MTAATGLPSNHLQPRAAIDRWESQLADFMTDLAAIQVETLEVLTQKRECLAKINTEGLAAVGSREQQLIDRLQACLQRRTELLELAESQGRPGSSIEALAKSLPLDQRGNLEKQVRQASSRTRLLRHHSLTNWVLAQRTLLHLSQMLEIIATGGRKRPTYSKELPADCGGSLVDRVA
ncbi:MAG: flagellar export chaperone FlgN [Thermoguttaceae bacterium]